MQAIGFLSRREYSRQELRAKLLDSLRKRAREDAAQAAAAEATERGLALAEARSNGIDDAFAPRAPAPAFRGAPAAPGWPAPAPAHAPVSAPAPAFAPAPASASASASASAPARTPTRAAAMAAAPSSTVTSHPALATLTRGDGRPLPPALQRRLAAAVADSAAVAPGDVAASTGRALDGDDRDSPADACDDASVPLRAPTATRPSFGATDAADPLEQTDPEAAVDQLLDWLAANKYLNEARFVESRVNARARKQGTLRIKLELSRHGLSLAPEQAADLRATEFARAQALWERKFGAVAPDAHARAKQARFLAARGFAADVVRRVVGGLEED